MSESIVGALREQYMPDMPPLERGGYLVGYLLEIGPTMAAGMGAAPITHLEISAWCDLTGVELQPWEIRFLRRLSGEYLNESQRAEKRGAKAPWREIKPDLSSVAKSMQQQISEIANL